MYRLTITLGVCATVFAFATVVQSFRLWEAREEAAALRHAAVKTQRDMRKQGFNVPDTGFPNAASSQPEKGDDGGATANAAPETANGTPSGKGGSEKDSGFSPDTGKKGADHKGTAGRTETAKAADLASGGGANGRPGGGGGKADSTPGAKEKSADGKSAAKIDPAKSNELCRAAQALVKSGDLEQARSVLRQSLQENPENTNSWHQLAMVERQLGNVDAELNTYKQWAEARPDEKIARYLAAEACVRNGMDDQALQYLADFQTMSRDDPQSNAMTAGIYQQMNMTAEQGDALRQWVSAAPTSPDAHRVLGDYYEHSGQPDLALAEFQRMAALQPNNPTPYMELGNTYLQMGQTDEALSQFQTAVNIRPNSTEALTRLALAQRQSGDMQGAMTNYQRIVDLEPGSPVGVDAARHIQSIQTQLGAQTQNQP